MARYNPDVVHQYADALYARADIVLVLYIVIGAAVGFVGGSVGRLMFPGNGAVAMVIGCCSVSSWGILSEVAKHWSIVYWLRCFYARLPSNKIPAALYRIILNQHRN